MDLLLKKPILAALLFFAFIAMAVGMSHPPLIVAPDPNANSVFLKKAELVPAATGTHVSGGKQATVGDGKSYSSADKEGEGYHKTKGHEENLGYRKKNKGNFGVYGSGGHSKSHGSKYGGATHNGNGGGGHGTHGAKTNGGIVGKLFYDGQQDQNKKFKEFMAALQEDISFKQYSDGDTKRYGDSYDHVEGFNKGERGSFAESDGYEVKAGHDNHGGEKYFEKGAYNDEYDHNEGKFGNKKYGGLKHESGQTEGHEASQGKKGGNSGKHNHKSGQDKIRGHNDHLSSAHKEGHGTSHSKEGAHQGKSKEGGHHGGYHGNHNSGVHHAGSIAQHGSVPVFHPFIIAPGTTVVHSASVTAPQDKSSVPYAPSAGIPSPPVVLHAPAVTNNVAAALYHNGPSSSNIIIHEGGIVQHGTHLGPFRKQLEDSAQPSDLQPIIADPLDNIALSSVPQAAYEEGRGSESQDSAGDANSGVKYENEESEPGVFAREEIVEEMGNLNEGSEHQDRTLITEEANQEKASLPEGVNEREDVSEGRHNEATTFISDGQNHGNHSINEEMESNTEELHHQQGLHNSKDYEVNNDNPQTGHTMITHILGNRGEEFPKGEQVNFKGKNEGVPKNEEEKHSQANIDHGNNAYNSSILKRSEQSNISGKTEDSPVSRVLKLIRRSRVSRGVVQESPDPKPKRREDVPAELSVQEFQEKENQNNGKLAQTVPTKQDNINPDNPKLREVDPGRRYSGSSPRYKDVQTSNNPDYRNGEQIAEKDPMEETKNYGKEGSEIEKTKVSGDGAYGNNNPISSYNVNQAQEQTVSNSENSGSLLATHRRNSEPMEQDHTSTTNTNKDGNPSFEPTEQEPEYEEEATGEGIAGEGMAAEGNYGHSETETNIHSVSGDGVQGEHESVAEVPEEEIINEQSEQEEPVQSSSTNNNSEPEENEGQEQTEGEAVS